MTVVTVCYVEITLKLLLFFVGQRDKERERERERDFF